MFCVQDNNGDVFWSLVVNDVWNSQLQKLYFLCFTVQHVFERKHWFCSFQRHKTDFPKPTCERMSLWFQMWYTIWKMKMKHLHGVLECVCGEVVFFFPLVVSSMPWFANVWDLDVRDIDVCASTREDSRAKHDVCVCSSAAEDPRA